MINRRLLRIKALQELYAFSKSGDKDLVVAEKELFHSIDKSYELYLIFLSLVVEIRHYAFRKASLVQNRRIKDQKFDEEYARLSRLASNRAIKVLEESQSYIDAGCCYKVDWVAAENIVVNYFNAIINSDYFENYMSGPDSLAADKRLVEHFYCEILGDYDYLFEYLEDNSIFWNDDVDYVASIAAKTFWFIKDENVQPSSLVFELFRDKELEEFVTTLFRKSCVNFSKYDTLIKENLVGWEFDRVAEMDLLIVKLAITEAIEFKKIPLKVTLNEYIDIAKYYSTDKSGVFVNGILDRIFKRLDADGLIPTKKIKARDDSDNK